MSYEDMRGAMFREGNYEPDEEMTDKNLVTFYHQCKRDRGIDR